MSQRVPYWRLREIHDESRRRVAEVHRRLRERPPKRQRTFDEMMDLIRQFPPRPSGIVRERPHWCEMWRRRSAVQ